MNGPSSLSLHGSKRTHFHKRIIIMPDNGDLTRREFMRLSAMAGGSLLLTRSMDLFAGTNPAANIKSRGYAAIDTSGKLQPWEFERRPVGDDDVLIDIKFASICHSDIHQMKGHWGRSNTPRCPAMRSWAL